jgi:hypothetical protein
MGLELRLFPLPYPKAEHCDEILELIYDETLYDEIADLERKKGIDVPRGGISTYVGDCRSQEETKYGLTEETPYGERMKSLLACELSDIMKDFPNMHTRNKAVAAYMGLLHPEIPVYLYWH